MQRWHFGPRRYVPHELFRAHAGASAPRSCSRTSSRTPSCRSSSLRDGSSLPIVAHVASWDHTVGKGVIAPFCDAYIVQNEAMRDDLARYHGIGSERVVVTGWPQTDIYARQRPRERLREPSPRARARSVVSARRRHGEHARRTRRSRIGSSNASSTGGRPPDAARPSLLFRPHPRDTEWRERFRAALETDGIARAGGELHRLRGARDAPPALRLRRRERRDDPARRARQRSSGGLRPLRRGRPAGRELRDEERHRRALPRAGGLRTRSTRRSASRRWYAASSARSRIPLSSPTSDARVAHEVVGEVDGRAAERVVDAIVRSASPALG